jgi:hypothetical protein
MLRFFEGGKNSLLVSLSLATSPITIIIIIENLGSAERERELIIQSFLTIRFNCWLITGRRRRRRVSVDWGRLGVVVVMVVAVAK